MADSESDYQVGPGRPPVHTRFKKGQSGNPGGRSTKSLPALLVAALMPHRTQRWLAAGKISLAVPILAVGPFVAGSEAAVWVPDHVVIVIEENLSYRSLVPTLTYLSELMRDHANFTNSHGIDHPSQPNYLALFSGSTQGTGSEAKRNPDGSNPIIGGRTQVGSNEPIKDTPLNTPNLGAALIRAGRSLAGYSEDLPFPGFTGNAHFGGKGSSVDYQRKHNPWVNWQAVSDSAIGKNQLSSTTNLPFSAFPTDNAGFAKLPTVTIVVPNQINDGHQSEAAAPGTERGVFTSIVELQTAINRFIAEANHKPKPFVWTKSADAILAAVQRGRQALEAIH